jgi:hypothetical protein
MEHSEIANEDMMEVSHLVELEDETAIGSGATVRIAEAVWVIAKILLVWTANRGSALRMIDRCLVGP